MNHDGLGTNVADGPKEHKSAEAGGLRRLDAGPEGDYVYPLPVHTVLGSVFVGSPEGGGSAWFFGVGPGSEMRSPPGQHARNKIFRGEKEGGREEGKRRGGSREEISGKLNG